VWKHHPLEFHPDAPLAHLASVAAFEQGKFWPFHDKVFASQPKIKRDDLWRCARESGLDMKRFEESIRTARGQSIIDRDLAEAKALGVTGTPAFFINGHFLSGAKPFDEFAKVINGELERLKLPVPPGTATAGG
jgi:protein-disulfide isomerase